MDPVRIDVLCEVAGGADAQLDPVRETLAAELDVIATDLQLQADFRIDVRASPAITAERAASQPALALYVDGVPLPPWSGADAAAAIRAHLVELVAPRLVDHWWEAWGGASVAPPDFIDLMRDLVRHRVAPSRASAAVAAWGAAEAQPFDAALNQVDRRIRVHVHPARVPDLAANFAPEANSPATMMIDGLFYELGLVLGECLLVADPAQPQDRARVRINDLRSAAIPLLQADECVVNDTPERLTLLNIKGRDAINPSNGGQCAIISRSAAAVAEQAGLTTWDAGGWLVVSASTEVTRAAAAVLNPDAVGSLLDRLQTAFPYLVSYVRERIGEPRFGRVLRRLLHEGISIRNMRQVINGLALMAPSSAPVDAAQFIVFSSTYPAVSTGLVTAGRTPDPLAVEMTEMVRAQMKRYISNKYTRGGSTLIVYLLAPDLEQRLRERRALSAAERRWLLDAVAAEVIHLPATTQQPCVLTTSDIRHRLHSEIEAAFPRLAVLSYQDLSPELNIQPIARITPDRTPLPGLLESIDEGLDALRFEDAEAAIRRAVRVVPATLLATRMIELCYVLNEAGSVDRVIGALGLWLQIEDGTDTGSAIKALVDQPDPAAVRAWLVACNPLLVRRLRAKYRPAADDLVLAKGGTFAMGEVDTAVSDRPAHQVELDTFSIAPCPITGAQFALYCLASGRPVPPGCVRSDEAARGIDWVEAIAYCNWLSMGSGLEPVYSFADKEAGALAVTADPTRGGFRLPTEAEREYAARGGALSSGFHYAGSDRPEEVSIAGTAVATCPANELGLYDMSCGPEWCWDWYSAEYYSTSPARNPTGPQAGTLKVCRGGDIGSDGDREASTVFHRGRAPAEHADGPQGPQAKVGFRIARTGEATR